jgi:hypothetical protein
MGLYQRGKNWWMSFTVNGVQERRSAETTDKKTAQKIYHKVMTELAEGKYFKKPIGTKKTVEEMIEQYLEVYSKPNKAASSHKNGLEYAKYFIKFFGEDDTCYNHPVCNMGGATPTTCRICVPLPPTHPRRMV